MEATRDGTLFAEQHSQFAESIIGGEGGLSFDPHIRCKRWGEEGSFALRLPDSSMSRGILPTMDRGKIEWLDAANKVGMRAYSLPVDGTFEQGGLEFEILLSGIPLAPTIALPFETTGLDLHWQGPLTRAQQQRGQIRPDNVLNSIVAVHSTRSPFHFERGAAAKYKTGKAWHLYRPEAIDANGVRHWVDWSLDRDANQLVLVFDAWFLSAAYPVAIDPTIGYTSTPGSIDGTNGYMLLNKFTAGASGDANPGAAFVYGDADSGTLGVKACSYANGAASPDGKARLSQSSSITLTTTPDSRTAAITWTGIVSGTSYFVGVAGSFGCNVYYDDLGATCWYDALAVDETPPATYGTFEGTFSGTPGVYVDFTAGGLVSGPPFFRRKNPIRHLIGR